MLTDYDCVVVWGRGTRGEFSCRVEGSRVVLSAAGESVELASRVAWESEAECGGRWIAEMAPWREAVAEEYAWPVEELPLPGAEELVRVVRWAAGMPGGQVGA